MMSKFIFAVMIAFVSINVGAKSIVVMGDSISAAYGFEVEKGWVALLQKKLQNENLNYTVYNESIAGETSAGGLARIDKVLALYKPEVLLLELGGNDGLRGLSVVMMKKNLAEISNRALHSGAKVLLLGMRIPPNYGKRYVDMFYNAYLDLSKQSALPMVPFLLEDIALNQNLIQQDRLHPNELAQPKIVEKVWHYLQPILKKNKNGYSSQ